MPIRNSSLTGSGSADPIQALVSGAGIVILTGATAGQDSGWFDYFPGMRLAYALDSGTTSTNLSLDMSADGVTSIGQYGTDTWASSATTKITQPIWLTNVNVRKLRLNVLTGGPISAEARK